MANFLGHHYEVRLDDKGRIKLPATLLNKIPEEERNTFMVKKGFEEHLSMYTLNEWLKIIEKIGTLNMFVTRNRDFKRRFYNQITEVNLDKTGRILLPKTLLDKVKIEKDIVLFAHDNEIEIWDKKKFNLIIDNDEINLADLAELVMGKEDNITPDD